jgi:hypothetical protein
MSTDPILLPTPQPDVSLATMCDEDVSMVRDMNGSVSTVDSNGFTAIFNATENMKTAWAPTVREAMKLRSTLPLSQHRRQLDIASDAALASLFNGDFVATSEQPPVVDHGAHADYMHTCIQPLVTRGNNAYHCVIRVL